MQINRYKTEDGRRGETRITENTLPDGQIEQITETMEEALPLQLTKKITRRMMAVPVEEKHETFASDGSVETVVKSVNQNRLSLDSKSVSLEDIMHRLDTLEGSQQSTVSKKSNLKDMLGKSLDVPKTDTPSKSNIDILTVGGWIGVVVMAALCVCKFMGISLL